MSLVISRKLAIKVLNRLQILMTRAEDRKDVEEVKEIQAITELVTGHIETRSDELAREQREEKS